LGGSTTFGQGEADESLTYPQILEDILNEKLSSPVVEVINAGTPAWTSAELLINLQFRILELSPDMIIVYEGVNDTFAMSRDGEGKSDYSNFRCMLKYVQPGPGTKALLRNSAFFRLLYIGANDVSTDITRLTITPVPAGTNEDKNLERATGKYFRRNIESLVAIAQANNIVTVLATMGHGPWHGSLGLNNSITREIAETKGTVLVDFESTAHLSYFTEDQVHLKKAGNAALAHEIANVLLKPDFDFFIEKMN
jgi:lysophospholipase L1-like esterase